MKNAILLRSRMTRNRHVRFWSRVRRGDLLGLDNNKTSWIPQIEGSKTAVELPGILDEVISMIAMKKSEPDGRTILERKFICHTLNTGGYPAKDRSGRLNEIEDAHLGKLLNKIKEKGKQL